MGITFTYLEYHAQCSLIDLKGKMCQVSFFLFPFFSLGPVIRRVQLLWMDQCNSSLWPKSLLLSCPADLSSSHVAVITLGGLVWGFIHFPFFGNSFLSEEYAHTKLSKHKMVRLRTISNVQWEKKQVFCKSEIWLYFFVINAEGVSFFSRTQCSTTPNMSLTVPSWILDKCSRTSIFIV